jgi:HSP20 family molecular chaperone IbpA
LAAGSWKQMALAAEAQVAEPAFALEEQEDCYLLKALVPGLRPESVRLEGSDSSLRLSGISQLRFAGGNRFGYVRERPVGEVFTLPPDADGARMTYRVTSAGVLIAEIPRHRCLKIVPEPQVPVGSHSSCEAKVAAGANPVKYA